jgi:hypothetical protein
MINVNQITSQLARMPDQALQQYAMMHKNDPYTVSLALSESNRRKQMRDAAQGQQGMAPQPKVVDQGIAGMAAPSEMNPAQMEALMQQLDRKKEQEYREFTRGAAPAPQPMPEDVGIGALPAPNMQGMAGGGIVAFGGGGDVQRFDGGGAVDAARARRDAAQQTLYTYGLRQRRDDPQGFMAAQNEFNTAQQAVAAAEAAYAAEMSGTGTTRAAMGAQDVGATKQFSTLPAVAPAVVPPVAAAPGAPTLRFPPTAPPASSVKTPPVAGPRPASAASNKPPVAPVAPAAQAGLGDLATTYSDILKKQDFKDPAEARLGALEAKERAATEENKAALLRDQAKFDDAYKGREKRLSDRELDIGKQKDTNTGLALLNAGLSIMSTPGGLATAIGKGAQVGTAQFAAGLDKIRSAQERLDDARDKMEDLKLNRAEMSAKQIRDAEKDIRNVGIDAEKRGIDGLRMAADVNRRTAADMFKATVDVGVNRERMESAQNIAEMQEKGQSSRSAAQIAATLNTPDRLIFNKLLKDNNNDAVAAATALQKLKTEKFSVTTSYADYLKSFAGKDTLTPPLSFANYAAQFGATLPR